MNPTAMTVLVVDDSGSDGKEGGFGETLALEMGLDDSFEFTLAYTEEQARQAASAQVFDIFVFDVYLRGTERGFNVARDFRRHGFQQPMILVTGNIQEQEKPLREYIDLFAQGPTYFYFKGGTKSVSDIVRDAAGKTDVLLRTLNIFRRAKMPFGGMVLGKHNFSLDQLLGIAEFDGSAALGNRRLLEDARRQLREGLTGLLLTSVTNKNKTGKPKK